MTVGLAICAVGLWLLGGLAEDIRNGEALSRLDQQLFATLHHRATPVGYQAFQIISLLGSPITTLIVWLLVAIQLRREGRRFLLGGWTAAFVGGWILEFALKAAMHRPRPPDADLFLVGFSWSFPSGHAMGSLIAYGMLGYMLIAYWVSARGGRVAIVAGGMLVVLLVGMSRLYLGVHYLSDVLAGYAAGTLWLAACVSGLEVARRLPHAAAS